MPPRTPRSTTSTSTQATPVTAVICCEPVSARPHSAAASRASSGPMRARRRATSSDGRDADRDPGGAREQPEGLHAREQLARDAVGQARVDRADAVGADQPGRRIGAQHGDQVVERRQRDERVRSVQQAVGEQRRRIQGARLRVGRERLSRERVRVPERQVPHARAGCAGTRRTARRTHRCRSRAGSACSSVSGASTIDRRRARRTRSRRARAATARAGGAGGAALAGRAGAAASIAAMDASRSRLATAPKGATESCEARE